MPRKRTGPKMPHGGKREGAGRPTLGTVKKMYKLEPRVVDTIKTIAQANNRTESNIANEFLYVMAFQERRPDINFV